MMPFMAVFASLCLYQSISLKFNCKITQIESRKNEVLMHLEQSSDAPTYAAKAFLYRTPEFIPFKFFILKF